MTSLHTIIEGIYLFATIFGLGVVAIESVGLLGDADGDGGGHSLSHDGGHHDGADADGDSEGGIALNDQAWQRDRAGRGLFRALTLFRLSNYFALGFGPMGLISLLEGAGGAISLAFAAGAGCVSAVLYRLVIRFQRQDVDSTVHDRQLIGETGQVIIAIHPDEIGRVRIRLGQMVCERYAVSDRNDFIPKGGTVVVQAFNDQGLVVSMSPN